MNVAAPEDSQRGELGSPLPKNHSQLPRFANFVIFVSKLRSIHGEGSKGARRKWISAFIESWKVHIGNDLHPVVRLLFPQEDEELRQLSKLKEQQLGKILVEAMNIPPKSTDASTLLATRKSSHSNGSDEDSLAFRARCAAAKRYSNTDYGHMRIDEVTDFLVEFANAKKERRIEIMTHSINAMNPDEIYWVVRILLRNLAINCSERLFLNIFHENALQVYMVNKNLKTVCHQSWSEDFSVSESDKAVHLMSYYCPMKAKFVKGAVENMNSVVELFRKKSEEAGNLRIDPIEFFMEEKIDGERVQLHWKREGSLSKFYSRRGTDYTTSYRGIFDNSNGSDSADTAAQDNDEKHVSSEDIISDDTKECILDGEIVAWDPYTNDICGQSKVRELTTHDKGGTYRHMILVFDVVFYNGLVLTERSLRDRKQILEKILPVEKRQNGAGRIQLLPYKLGKTAKDVSVEFERAIAQMSEGLVLKNPESYYESDGKSNSWVKVKPEFVDGYQGENLDSVVVGCYRGSGRLSNQFSSYSSALRDETKPSRYVAFTGVGSGICSAMYNHINGLSNEHIYAQAKPPNWLDLGNNKKPDFYIDPEKSVVLEIKYSEIATVNAEKGGNNLNYGVGYSLRFPRYVRTREDKDKNSILTVGEMLEMLNLNNKRSQKSHYEILKKERAMQNPRVSLAKRVKVSIDDGPVDLVKDIFHGQPFYVCGDIQDPEIMSKPDLEVLIRKFGGVLTPIYNQAALPIADRNVPKVAQLTLEGTPVIKPKYIFDCIDNGKLFLPEPVHYFNKSVRNANSSTALVDRYDFSLYRTQSMDEVRHLFNLIPTDTIMLNEEQSREMLDYLINPLSSEADELHVATFIGIKAYLPEKVAFRVVSEEMIKYGSGSIVPTFDDANLMIYSGDLNLLCARFQDLKVVDPQWVFDRWHSHNYKKEIMF